VCLNVTPGIDKTELPTPFFDRIAFVDPVGCEAVRHDQYAQMLKAHTMQRHESRSNVRAKSERAAPAVDDHVRRARLRRGPFSQVGHALRTRSRAVEHGARNAAALEKRCEANIKNRGWNARSRLRQVVCQSARFHHIRGRPWIGFRFLGLRACVPQPACRHRQQRAERKPVSP
jgi:hypothetical protein